MKRKFTKKYLKSHLIYYNYDRDLFARSTCQFIEAFYPDYLKSYKKFLQKEFNFDPENTIWESKKCESTSSSSVTLLRIMLLQSFENAILNGEVECLKN